MEIVQAKNVKLDLISYGGTKNNSMISLNPIKYNDKFFILNFPKMYLDSDTITLGNKKMFFVSFRGFTNNLKLRELYQTLNNIDTKVQEDINSNNIDNIDDLDNIEIKYVPLIKDNFVKFQKNYPTLKIYFTEETKFYDADTGELLNDKYLVDDIIKKYREITCLVYVKYVWSAILQMGVYLELLEAKVSLD